MVRVQLRFHVDDAEGLFVQSSSIRVLAHFPSSLDPGVTRRLSKRGMADKPPSLRFAWWNTGVAPPWIESQASLEHREIATRIVERLIVAEGCAFVGLGEVRREPVLTWLPDKLHANWAAISDQSGNRNDSDIGLLYDRSRLDLVDQFLVTVPFAGSDVRAGHVAILRTTDGFAPAAFVVALAHWRADMGDIADAAARRSRAAQGLRDAISKQMDDSSSTPHVLVMGDFNTEPFHDELRTDLPTARARDVVREHSRVEKTNDLLLYNPCWRLLGEQRPWTGSMIPSFAGSYRTQTRSRPSAWRTFDQILVSGSLLGTRGWVLREDQLRLWTDDVVFDPSRPSFLKEGVDHLPICGFLQWIDGAV